MPYWIYEVGKTIHFIGLVSWFAALFYMPRLFIYHTEALDKEETEREILTAQFEIMQRRLYHIIMTPAMIITFVGGFMMLAFYGWSWFTINSWMHWKLGLIILLIGYHFYNKKIMNKLAEGDVLLSSAKLRMFNEIATILLLGIVLLAVFKSRIDFVYAFLTIILFMMLLMLGIKAYKRYRQNKGEA